MCLIGNFNVEIRTESEEVAFSIEAAEDIAGSTHSLERPLRTEAPHASGTSSHAEFVTIDNIAFSCAVTGILQLGTPQCTGTRRNMKRRLKEKAIFRSY